MRYIKYNGYTDIEALRSQYNERKDRPPRKVRILNKLGTAVFIIVTVGLFLGFAALYSLRTEPEGFVWGFADTVFTTLLMSAVLLVCLILGILAAAPLWSYGDKDKKLSKQQALNQSCAYLQDFYGLQEPCLVTKCYESSDSRFSLRDVNLFFLDSELRITADLRSNFIYPEKDPGCYIFQKDEIRVALVPREHYFAVELTAGGVSFLLGSKAKVFLESNLG